MFRCFGAHRLSRAEMPELSRVLAELCRRAQLARLPDLYYVPAATSMNAFACGGPGGSAIVITEGLLRGMCVGEIASILAHEVAHIRNQDAWTMNWASALCHAIELTASTALAVLQGESDRATTARALTSLLRAAPAIGRLLCLGLSRIRELDADATALELIGNSQALVGALAKLERHHSGSPILAAAAFDDGPTRFLRTHPATSERVGTLLGFVH